MNAHKRVAEAIGVGEGGGRSGRAVNKGRDVITGESSFVVFDADAVNTITFNQIGTDKFMTDNISHMDKIQVPIIALCETARNSSTMFASAEDIHIMFKHDGNNGSIVMSPHQIVLSSYAKDAFASYQVTESLAESMVNATEDGDDGVETVCVEAIVRKDPNGDSFILVVASIPVKGWYSTFLKGSDLLYKYTRWLIPMLLGQATLAMFSYLVKGDPHYVFSAMSGFMINKAANLLGEEVLMSPF